MTEERHLPTLEENIHCIQRGIVKLEGGMMENRAIIEDIHELIKGAITFVKWAVAFIVLCCIAEIGKIYMEIGGV